MDREARQRQQRRMAARYCAGGLIGSALAFAALAAGDGGQGRTTTDVRVVTSAEGTLRGLRALPDPPLSDSRPLVVSAITDSASAMMGPRSKRLSSSPQADVNTLLLVRGRVIRPDVELSDCFGGASTVTLPVRGAHLEIEFLGDEPPEGWPALTGSTTTDREGAFELRTPRLVTVRLVARAWERHSGSVILSAHPNQRREVELHVGEGFAVRGWIDDERGDPLVRQRLFVKPTRDRSLLQFSRRADGEFDALDRGRPREGLKPPRDAGQVGYTDRAGAFEISVPARGRYDLFAMLVGREPAFLMSIDVGRYAGRRPELDVVLPAGLRSPRERAVKDARRSWTSVDRPRVSSSPPAPKGTRCGTSSRAQSLEAPSVMAVLCDMPMPSGPPPRPALRSQ